MKSLLLNRNITILICLNLLLAAAAFIKDIFMAKYFGTSEAADAFTLGFFIPDTIGNNLIATAIGVTCIPIFTRLLVEERFELLRLVVTRFLVIILFITTFLSIVLLIFYKPILMFFSQGIQDSTFSMICSDFLLMIPFVVLFPFLMVLSALLQSNQQFVLPALSQILFNMLWFLILFVLPFISVGVGEGGFYLAGGLTAAALINVMVLVPFTIKFWRLPISASKRKIKKKSINLYIKRITNQLLPFLLILILSQGLLFIERRFAAHLGEGTPAALNYAYRLVQFPIWVVVAAISTVLLPDLSNKVSRKQDHLVQNQMKKTILFIVVLSFFCSFGLFLLREPIISILFERGAFTALSVQNTSDLLEGYSWAIFGQSMTFIVLRYFTAYGKLLLPLIISIISFIISWVFDYAMIPLIGARALGYGASIGAFFNGLVFLFILFKEWGIFHEWYNGNRKGFFSHHSGL